MAALRSLVKRVLFGNPGQRPMTVARGLFKGCRLHLDPAYESQVFFGLAERETHSFIRQALLDWRWAVDVGAAKGELTVFLLRQVHLQKIVALEPDEGELRQLRQNLELNGLAEDRRLEILQCFAGTDESPNHLRLDELELRRDQPGFLKIDVDGAELDVLQSGPLLLQGQVDVLVETHSLELEERCVDYLEGLSYRAEIIPNAGWRWLVPEQRPLAHNRWLWATRLY